MNQPVVSKETPIEIGAFAAKTELSKLLRQTRAGKSFIITQRGHAGGRITADRRQRNGQKQRG